MGSRRETDHVVRLPARELGKLSAGYGHQLVPRALLHNTAAADDRDGVGVADGAEPVGDGDGGSPLLGHDLVEGGLDDALARRVERRGGLVEKQDGRLAHHRTGDCHALLLPSREHAAALAHLRLIPERQVPGDEAVRVGRARRLLHLGACGALLAISNVFGHSAEEEDRLLPDEGHLPAQPPHIELAQVDAVEQQRAALRVVEALEQRDECRLAGARWATESDRLPCPNLERVAVADQVIGRGRVGEDDAAHGEVARYAGGAPAAGREGVDGRDSVDGGVDWRGHLAGSHDEGRRLGNQHKVHHADLVGGRWGG
eukprot:scaffold2188_cov102-Isochrysis_galbana.AAC.2